MYAPWRLMVWPIVRRDCMSRPEVLSMMHETTETRADGSGKRCAGSSGIQS